MEQSDADRAAVAREVLTELEQHFRDDPLQGLGATAATVVKWFRDEHYPAPPAPETVTVTFRDGSTETLSLRDGKWQSGTGLLYDELIERACLDRIASDARVIRERDARIAELEESVAKYRTKALAYGDIVHGCTPALEAAGHSIASGGTISASVAALVAERDAAWRALEERANNAGPTEGVRESGAGSTPATLVPASPAPIPLGAVIGDYEWNGKQWERRTMYNFVGERLRLSVGSDLHESVTGWYRAKHPVATRETVERVALAVRDADLARSYLVPMHVYHKLARAALTAAGFTLEEGA